MPQRHAATEKEPKARKALGKGLSALIPEAKPAASGESVLQIDIDLIAPNPDQPRKRFEPADLEALAQSIREQGVISPLVLREAKGRYELIAGERRWRAAQLAGLQQVPAIVRNVHRSRAVEMALVENIQRADLNAIEEAHAYELLQDELQMKQDEIARRVGKDRTTIANALRLLKLPPALQELIIEGKMTAGHARAVLSLSDALERERLAQRIVSEGLTVRQAERLAQPRAKAAKAPPSATADVFVRQAEERLVKALGTKVRIEKGAKGGRISIEFYSDEELTRLFDRLVRA